MLTSLCLSLALADVLDVDPVTGPYLEIRDAVAAAAPGDVIRVRTGSYGYFTVQAKSLDIAAFPDGANVVVNGSVRVQGLGPSDTVTISGLEVRGPQLPAGNVEEAVVIGANSGSVHLEDCRILGGQWEGVRVLDSQDAAFVGCEIIGGEYGLPWARRPASALTALHSRVRLEETVVRPEYVLGEFYDGPDAVTLSDSSLSILGGTISGASGGAGDCCCLGNSFIEPGQGGNGIRAFTSTVEWLGASISGGPAGWANGCSPAANGQPIVAVNSSVSALPGSTPRLTVNRDIVMEREPVTVTLAAEVGEILILAVGTESLDQSLPGAGGSLAVGGGAGVVRRVVFASAGTSQTLTFPAPEVPPFDAMVWWFQSIRLTPLGALQFGVHRRLIVLDDRW